MKGKLFLLALSISSCLATGEIMLRFVYEPPPLWREPQACSVESPLLGWVLKPGWRGFTIDAPVSINSLGLRDEEFSQRKPDGEYRILCLGDSFTFALGVGFDDLYVQQLERLLKQAYPGTRVQVINAGVSGYNTRQELIYLQSRGLAFDPDLVVVAFYWNDIIGNEKDLPDPEEASFFAPGRRKIQWGKANHALPAWVRTPMRRSLLLYRSIQAAKGLLTRLNPPTDRSSVVYRAVLAEDSETLAPYWEATAQRLQELALLCQNNEVPLLLLVFPTEEHTRRRQGRDPVVERLAKIWGPTGRPLIDVSPAFRESLARGENPFLPDDRHPNATGMRIAAEALFEAIIEGEMALGDTGRACRGNDPVR